MVFKNNNEFYEHITINNGIANKVNLPKIYTSIEFNYNKIINNNDVNNKININDNKNQNKVNSYNDKNVFNNLNNFDLNFIDGGQGLIVDSPNLIVAMLRIALINKKITISNYYVILKKINNEWNITLWDQNKNKIDDLKFDVKESGRELLNKIRKNLEWKTVLKLNNSIVILDGTLEYKDEFEKKSLLNLINYSKKNNLVLCGLAKTSILTMDNSVSAPYYFNKNYKDLFFIKVGNNNEMDINVFFVKLHFYSKYCFRFELLNLFNDKFSKINYLYNKNNNNNLNQLMIKLVENSNDPSFYGYPYGLIKADFFARITNEELSYERTKFFIESKREDLLSELENSINAHNILDNMQF